VPRIAVGTVQPGADALPTLWGLLEAFRRIGVQTQSFYCRAHFPRHDAALSITGLSARYLDSWLMSPDTCRHLFCRAGCAVDLAVVEGSYDQLGASEGPGGRLEPLCQWLDLPRLIVLDVARLETCCRPNLPLGAAGILLDGIADARQGARLSVELELLWGIPVLGAMELAPQLRGELARVPRGDPVPIALCRQFADRFARCWKPGRILELADRGEIPPPNVCPGCCKLHDATTTVAIAYDEAFRCYFPDVLDLLELGGARIVDFSPLRDEHLPPGTDVVYFGSGHPERYAAALAENHCMLAALRSHVRAGRRIYGEGGGAAYLCQQMELPTGRFRRMAGILPAIARLNRQPQPAPAPVEVVCAQPSWLGDAGTRLRGYRNSSWSFEALDGTAHQSEARPSGEGLFGTFQAIGSAVHLNFAAHPKCLQRFLWPELPTADFADRSALPCLPQW